MDSRWAGHGLTRGSAFARLCGSLKALFASESIRLARGHELERLQEIEDLAGKIYGEVGIDPGLEGLAISTLQDGHDEGLLWVAVDAHDQPIAFALGWMRPHALHLRRAASVPGRGGSARSGTTRPPAGSIGGHGSRWCEISCSVSRIDPGEIEHVVGQCIEPFAFGHDDFQILPLLLRGRPGTRSQQRLHAIGRYGSS